MAAANFRVDPGALQALAGQMSSLAGELGAAGRTTPDAGAAGHPDVETAVQDFASHWADQMQKAENLLTQISGRLGGAASGYGATDSGVSSEFGSG